MSRQLKRVCRRRPLAPLGPLYRARLGFGDFFAASCSAVADRYKLKTAFCAYAINPQRQVKSAPGYSEAAATLYSYFFI